MNRVWVYQANRKLSVNEQEKVNAFMQHFIANWKAHGAKLNADYELLHGLFLVIKVDERSQEATGCSIDESVHALKGLQQELGIDFFNRQRTAFELNGEVEECSLAEFKAKAQAGEITGDTMVFNNAISTQEEYESNWKIPASQSWHNRVLA
ncbi:MAG: ABC transporter ATPase [Bacteroidetes bacterium]|nr:ABC transporter ATPase [Bacteroidota bacterium]